MQHTLFGSEDFVITRAIISITIHPIHTFHLSGKVQLLVSSPQVERGGGMSKCEYETISQTVESCHIFSYILSVLGDHL